jgi:hypothetical protein
MMRFYRFDMQYLYFLTSTNPSRVKIGIGNKLQRRVKQVEQSTKGHQKVLVAFDFPFGAQRTETYLHRKYIKHHAPLKFGSGRTEYFKPGIWLCEAVIIALMACVGQWFVIWGAVGIILYFGIRI